MYKISNDSIENANSLLEIIIERNMSGEEVFNMLTDWYGTCLITKEMCENLRDCEGFDEFDDDEEDDFDDDEDLEDEYDDDIYKRVREIIMQKGR